MSDGNDAVEITDEGAERNVDRNTEWNADRNAGTDITGSRMEIVDEAEVEDQGEQFGVVSMLVTEEVKEDKNEEKIVRPMEGKIEENMGERMEDKIVARTECNMEIVMENEIVHKEDSPSGFTLASTTNNAIANTVNSGAADYRNISEQTNTTEGNSSDKNIDANINSADNTNSHNSDNSNGSTSNNNSIDNSNDNNDTNNTDSNSNNSNISNNNNNSNNNNDNNNNNNNNTENVTAENTIDSTSTASSSKRKSEILEERTDGSNPVTVKPKKNSRKSSQSLLKLPIWFNLESVNFLEIKNLPEFFSVQDDTNSKSEQYVKIRNFIVNLYSQNPFIYLSATDCRKKIVGDVCVILRIHNFLDTFGLINFNVKSDCRPTLPSTSIINVSTPSSSTLSLTPSLIPSSAPPVAGVAGGADVSAGVSTAPPTSGETFFSSAADL